MSYFADIIKKEVRSKLQHEEEIRDAEKVLERVPPKLEESNERIEKAIQAAITLEEENEVAEELLKTYPDIDFTEFGLPTFVEEEEPETEEETDPEPEPEEEDTGVKEEEETDLEEEENDDETDSQE